MEKKFIFANWKAYAGYSETLRLAVAVKQRLSNLDLSQKEVVIFPANVFLLPLVDLFKDSQITLGVQDISQFEEGPFTGETPASMISGFAKYVLVGHSERRKEFGETSEIINRKIVNCFKFNLTPVVCVGSESELNEVKFLGKGSAPLIVYEPPEYIGGEKTQAVSEISEFSLKVRARFEAKFIYGGSLNEINAERVLSCGAVDGLLVGHSSLDPNKLAKIISLPA